jgi:hypothetical protein
MGSTSDYTSDRENGIMKYLPTEAFAYLERTSTVLATHVLTELAKTGEVESLRQAHAAGLSRVADIGLAADRVYALLHLVTQSEYEQVDAVDFDTRFELAHEWVAAGFSVHGTALITHASDKLDRLPVDARISRFRVLVNPEFGEIHHQLRIAHLNRWRHGRGEQSVQITETGEQVSRNFPKLALTMCRPPIKAFPITIALVDGEQIQTLNLLEQHFMEDRHSPSIWQEVAMNLEPGSEAFYQIGDCLLKLVAAMNNSAGSNSSYHAMLAYYRKKPTVPLSRVAAMLAIGAQFRDPQFAWKELIEARHQVSDGTTVPIWATFGIFDSDREGGDFFLPMLRRFMIEGQLAPSSQFAGSTLLQKVSRLGLEPEVDLLLELGADPRMCGVECETTPAALARDNGHEIIAAKLSAAAARTAMRVARGVTAAL